MCVYIYIYIFYKPIFSHFVLEGLTNNGVHKILRIICWWNLQRYEVFMVRQIQEWRGRARWGRQPDRHTLTVEWATGALALPPLSHYTLPTTLYPHRYHRTCSSDELHGWVYRSNIHLLWCFHFHKVKSCFINKYYRYSTLC